MTENSDSHYNYSSSKLGHTHEYLHGAVMLVLQKVKPRSIFELGCGNGSTANEISKHFEITGIDYSDSGIMEANKAFPHLTLNVGSAYDDLATQYGQFDVVLSLEVVEHLFEPRVYAKRVYELLNPGGIAIISTPYHGYWKNLALAISGKMDAHFTALWDGGHIKFWSRGTLRTLMSEAGLVEKGFRRVGRIPPLAKSMIATYHRPIKN